MPPNQQSHRCPQNTLSVRAKTDDSSGFTLLETLVVISILALVAGIVLVGTVGARKVFVVRDAAEQFAGHVKEAMTLTQNGVFAENCFTDDNDVDPEDRLCSWYVISIDGTNEYTRHPLGSFRPGSVTDPVGYRLPSSVRFTDAGDENAGFAYCPPLLYVVDEELDEFADDVAEDAIGVCENLREAGFESREFIIQHADDPAVCARVQVGTPSVVTVTMDSC